MRKLKRILNLVLAAAMSAGTVNTAYAQENPDQYDEQNMAETAAVTDGAYIPVRVSLRQADARSMLDMINDFRTGDEAWIWNSDKTEKIYIENLSPLSYDYELERVAVQRAAENFIVIGSTRPDGTSFSTAYPDSIRTPYISENIVYGPGDAESAFKAFKEENPDYSAEGLRRNILTEQNKYVGVACVVYEDGSKLWIQEFSSAAGDDVPVDYSEDVREVNVPVKEADWELKLRFADEKYQSDPHITLAEGGSMDLPAVSVKFYEKGEEYRSAHPAVDVISSDPSAVKIENGKLTAAGQGGARIVYTAAFGSYTETLVLYVNTDQSEHSYTLSAWEWAEDYSAASAVFTNAADSSDTVRIAAAITSEIQEPTCSEEGSAVYTASVTFEGTVYQDQKTVRIEPTGKHEYRNPAYTWAEDNTSVTADAVCSAGGETLTETVSTSYEVITAPAADAAGKGRFTAVFANQVFGTQTKEIELPAAGKISVPQLNLHYAMLICGRRVLLEAETDSENVYDSTFIWTSSDPSVVSVNAGGLARGEKPGTAVITATSLYGASASCTIRVLFSDVTDEERYYFEPVYWACENGITVGAGGPGKFSPDAPCTREQVVTFLWRLMGEPEPQTECSFTDVKTGDWYFKPVSWAAENGITTGLNDGTGRFGVGQPCTREQCVTFFHRAAGKPAAESHEDFTDVEQGRYFYDAISWAASKGITTGLNDGTGRFGVGMTCSRAMIVTFLYRYSKF